MLEVSGKNSFIFSPLSKVSTVTPFNHSLVHANLGVVVMKRETQLLSEEFVLGKFISLDAQLTEQILASIVVIGKVVQSLGSQDASLVQVGFRSS